MDKFQQIRNENPVFLYKNYHISESDNSIDVLYDFEIPNFMEFHPKWSFPKLMNRHLYSENNLILERLIFSLGMVEAISYWKSVCAPEMHVLCGELSSEQIKWWKKLYFKGLGEFFYVNNINTDSDSFINIIPSGSFKCSESPESDTLCGCLVPIGGGKDSALTIETLKNYGFNCLCYSINSRKSISATVETANLSSDKLITSKRIFDRSLINLNNNGYFNGHTPFSAIVAFSAEICAYIHGLKYIVLSNESSANESTVSGQDVNHQYSKSFEFENDFHSYEKNQLNTGIYYFSFLRPLSEFQIAKMFVSHEKFLNIFKSCNLGSKVSPDIWCANCPKCLFVCLILSPFVEELRLTEIFGKNLLEEPSMLPYFEQLIGITEHKPFECVGSIDEVNLAVSLAINKYLQNKKTLPLMFSEYVKKGLYSPEFLDEKQIKYCSLYNKQNLLPPEFSEVLIKEMERLL